MTGDGPIDEPTPVGRRMRDIAADEPELSTSLGGRRVLRDADLTSALAARRAAIRVRRAGVPAVAEPASVAEPEAHESSSEAADDVDHPAPSRYVVSRHEPRRGGRVVRTVAFGTGTGTSTGTGTGTSTGIAPEPVVAVPHVDEPEFEAAEVDEPGAMEAEPLPEPALLTESEPDHEPAREPTGDIPPVPEPPLVPETEPTEIPVAQVPTGEPAEAGDRPVPDDGPIEPKKPKRKKSVLRRLTGLFGVLLLLSGLGVLGYVGWQYWGTNYVAHKEQSRIIDQWNAGAGDAIGILRVPRWGKNYEVPIIPGGDLLGSKGADALARGVASLDDGAKPGEVGNFVLAGHRVTHGEPFSRFPALRRGDLIEIETRDLIYTYQLRNGGTDTIVKFTDGWPLKPVPSPDPDAKVVPTKAVITLVTCSELFHTDNRSVVIGDLIDTQMRVP